MTATAAHTTEPVAGERGGALLRRVAAGCGALCIPLAVVVVVLTGHLRADASSTHSRADALAAARSAAVALLSYDYRHLDGDIARARAHTAAPFRDDYSRTASRLKTSARRLRAIVSADVKTAAIVDASGDRAVVLLFVDQASVKQLPGQVEPVSRLDQNRVQMTLTRESGRWLVTNLTSV